LAKNIVSRVNRNLARRLREARREVGLSTRGVAGKLPRRLAVSHATIASYENGTTVPPIDILGALATLYSRPLNWFLENRETLGGFRYRNLRSRVPLSEQRQFEAVASKWADAYINLDRFLKDRSLRLMHRIDPFAHLPPERLAMTVRRAVLNLEDREPVHNMVAVLESFSAWALEVKAGFGVEGAAARHGDEFVVIINPQVANERIRLNAAHELAYILYGNDDNPVGGRIEEQAYLFASSLLLPRSQLEAAFKDKSFLKLIRFREQFGVSIVAMVYMAEKFSIINTSTARWLWSEIARRGWRQDEPGYVWRDRAITFETMLESAIQSKQISWDDAERITGIRDLDLKDRLAEITNGYLAKLDDEDRPKTLKFTEEA
jgi:Zn-dependent peptidase ImmA (M78 family)